MTAFLIAPPSNVPGAVSIYIDGLDELAALPRKYRAAAKVELEAAMRASLILVYRDLVPRMPYDQGGLLLSIKRNQPAQTKGGGGFIPSALSAVFGALTGSYNVTGEVISDSPYAAAVEDGRRPGAPAPYPLNRLAGWAGRKAGDPGLAWVIARAISEHGIEAKHPFQKTYENTHGQVSTLFEQAIDRALGRS